MWRIIEQTVIRFIIVSHENTFDGLRGECVSVCGIIKFHLGDAEEWKELSVIRFLAVRFERKGVVREPVFVFTDR